MGDDLKTDSHQNPSKNSNHITCNATHENEIINTFKNRNDKHYIINKNKTNQYLYRDNQIINPSKLQNMKLIANTPKKHYKFTGALKTWMFTPLD